VPTLDRIIDWALETVQKNATMYNLHVGESSDLDARFKSGIPSEYGFEVVDDIVD